MNAYEYAMKVEKDGEVFYKQLAEEANHEGLSKIFMMLANEEVKHYKIFEKLSTNSDTITVPTMEVFKEAKEELKHKELLENILEYVEQPEEWISSAEFRNIGA